MQKEALDVKAYEKLINRIEMFVIVSTKNHSVEPARSNGRLFKMINRLLHFQFFIFLINNLFW